MKIHWYVFDLVIIKFSFFFPSFVVATNILPTYYIPKYEKNIPWTKVLVHSNEPTFKRLKCIEIYDDQCLVLHYFLLVSLHV
jgi:hypothetical protein